jgi:hypothetical protein
LTWKKGESGNPAGLTKAPASIAALRQHIRDNAQGIILVLIKAALGGDVSAAKVLLDRSIPTLRPEMSPVILQAGQSDSLSQVGQVVIGCIARGEISPDIGTSLLGALASQCKIVEGDELVKRIERLETINGS